jgi:MFS family permease
VQYQIFHTIVAIGMIVDYDDPTPSGVTRKPASTIPQKSDSNARWAVLALSCLAMIGNYYSYDTPEALKIPLEEYAQLSELQYNLLYTVYSAPNIILPFFGGYLCDLMGASRAFVVFAAALVAGQAVFAFGVSIKSVGLMLVGRVLYGLGGENMAVGSSVILNDWFQGKEMAFAMALNVAVSRVGSVVSNVVSPIVADQTGVPAALWLGAIMCGLGLACAVALYPIDKAAVARVKAAKDEQQAVAGAPLSPDGTVVECAAEEVPEGNPLAGCKYVAKFSPSFWVLTVCCVVVYGCVLPFNNIANSLLLERDYFKPQPAGCALIDPMACQSAANRPNELCTSGTNWQLPLPSFIVQSDVVCTEDEWQTTSGLKCADDYCTRETDATKAASTVVSIPYFLSALLSPLLGGFVDRFGGRGLACLASSLLFVLVHALLGYSAATPYLAMVLQGLAYSLFARYGVGSTWKLAGTGWQVEPIPTSSSALWPSVPHLVPARAVGIAYGVVTAVQNAGLAAIPLGVSAIYEASGEKYIPNVELLFVLFAVGIPPPQ